MLNLNTGSHQHLPSTLCASVRVNSSLRKRKYEIQTELSGYGTRENTIFSWTLRFEAVVSADKHK
jgi:hypothetical protein